MKRKICSNLAFKIPIKTLLTGEKFGFDASNARVTNEEGAEIDSIEVIRDNDKLFIYIVEDPRSLI